jgi:hypothetical protein
MILSVSRAVQELFILNSRTFSCKSEIIVPFINILSGILTTLQLDNNDKIVAVSIAKLLHFK